MMPRSPLEEPTRDHIDDQLVLCAKSGDVASLAALLARGADPMAQRCRALRQAALSGQAECVRLLIPVSDPLAGDPSALLCATESGHSECVELLLVVSDPLADGSAALREAAYYGHENCVELLLPRSDPSARGPTGRNAAAEARHSGRASLAEFIEAWELSRHEAAALSDCSAAIPPTRQPRRTTL